MDLTNDNNCVMLICEYMLKTDLEGIRTMSILKQSKGKKIANFREPVTTHKLYGENLSAEDQERLDTERKERIEYLEGQARNIAARNKGGRPKKKDRLDLWRDCAHREDRALSEWIRKAVLFYITRHH
jgi:hypothetical protein